MEHETLLKKEKMRRYLSDWHLEELTLNVASRATSFCSSSKDLYASCVSEY